MVGTRLLLVGMIAAAFGASGGASAAETRARVEARHSLPARRSLAAFTPSLIDAPGLAMKPGATVDARQFRFTPSGKHADTRTVTIGVRARPVTLADATHASEQAGYDVGMAVATRGIALSGGVRRLDAGIAQREAVTLGLGYGRKDWTTTVRLGEENSWARGAQDATMDRRYSVELGTAYSLGQDVRVGAGVRYRIAPGTNADADASHPPADRSAFVGLGIAF